MVIRSANKRKFMKKKIKLYAYRNIPCKLIDYREEPDHVNASFERAPEWDMEKEIEVPDEPRSPRSVFIPELSPIRATESPEMCFSSVISAKKIIQRDIEFIEKLPDHVMVSKQSLTDIFYTQGWSPFVLETLCKELGLGE